MTPVLSDRGIPLIRQRVHRDHVIITAEHATKWYTLFLLHTTGEVTPLEYHLLEAEGMLAYVDHIPNPAAVAHYANRNGLAVDERSFEVMVGRWVREGLPTDASSLILPIEPDLEV